MTWFTPEKLEPRESYHTCPTCFCSCVTLYTGWDGIVIGCDECMYEERLEEPMECPVCGEEADSIYRQRGKVVGCRNCISEE